MEKGNEILKFKNDLIISNIVEKDTIMDDFEKNNNKLDEEEKVRNNLSFSEITARKQTQLKRKFCMESLLVEPEI